MIRAVLLLLLLSVPATAQEAARDAAIALQRAVQSLAAAQDADQQIAALTRAVEAYDTGLGVLRDGLRRIDAHQAALAADLAAREDRVSRLIGVLTGIERTPRPLLLMHPEGPMGTARAAMLLGDAAPALEAEAAALRADLAALQALRRLEESAATSLEAGVEDIQQARAALSVAISDRRTLPPRFGADGAALDAMRQQATTLASFAEALIDLPGQPGAALTDLGLPVRGTVLRRFREADAAGVERPGVILATSPEAPVVAPLRATVRHVGPLLDYGLVILLEPQPGSVLVLAGLDQAYVTRGQIVAAGATVGLMGDKTPDTQESDAGNAADASAFRAETLYVEVRERGTPVDPENWFDLSGTASQPNE